MQDIKIAGIEVRLSELGKASPLFWGWTLSLLILTALGGYAWYIQLKTGLVVTGMRDIFAWGFYIQNFIFFVGLAAGGLIIYSAVNLFGAVQFKPVSKLSVLQAGVCVLLAMLFILPDLGNPKNIYHFLLTPNFRSIFVFDAMILSIYFLLCLIDLYMLLSGREEGKLMLALTVISLPAAIGIHSITAWVLGLVKARELWHTALMAPLFISSALVSGLGLLILMLLLIRKYGGERFKFKDEMFYSMAALLAVIILVDLFFLLSEIITTFWPASAMPGHVERFALLTSGKYSAIFIPEILAFGLLPFALLAIPTTRKSMPVVALCSVLVVIGIFSKRFVLLAMGLAVSPLGVLAPYTPTLIELSITAGIWSIGMLVVTLAVKLLPMEVVEHVVEAPKPAAAAPPAPAKPSKCSLCGAEFKSMDECCEHAEKEHSIAKASCDMACEEIK